MCLSLYIYSFSRDLYVNHALLNTLQGIRTYVVKQSGKGMKKGLGLLVEDNLFFADTKALLASVKIKKGCP
jgi:hypothetical protein